MKWIDSFAIIGGLGTTFSFAPQVYKVYKNNDVEGLSSYMLGIHFSGVTCWLFYGFFIKDVFVLFFNGITLLMLSLIIGKYFYKRNRTVI
jgi:MtN3 and saliva related transmembrane protein